MDGRAEGTTRLASGGWVTTAAGRHLAGRRNRDTKPEVVLRSALHRDGRRFRLQVLLVRGCRPDILLPRHRLAVFVDGCWWHGCPLHGRKTPFTGPNAALWEAKMQRNRVRDQRATALGEGLGYTVVRVWECEVLADPYAVARSLPFRDDGRM